MQAIQQRFLPQFLELVIEYNPYQSPGVADLATLYEARTMRKISPSSSSVSR